MFNKPHLLEVKIHVQCMVILITPPPNNNNKEYMNKMPQPLLLGLVDNSTFNIKNIITIHDFVSHNSKPIHFYCVAVSTPT